LIFLAVCRKAKRALIQAIPEKKAAGREFREIRNAPPANNKAVVQVRIDEIDACAFAVRKG